MSDIRYTESELKAQREQFDNIAARLTQSGHILNAARYGGDVVSIEVAKGWRFDFTLDCGIAYLLGIAHADGWRIEA